MGEQEQIPKQRKQQSRKQECVGVRGKQKSLIKCRVEMRGRESGGAEGFISQAQAELQLQPSACSVSQGRGWGPGRPWEPAPPKDTESQFYLMQRIKQNRSVGWELGAGKGLSALWGPCLPQLP